jgi:DNA-binding Lrp family transcriptional regulator
MQESPVDKTDVKIIQTLVSDARLSYRQVGKKSGVSAATAMVRIKKLEKAGIIEGYTVRLNHEKLGYELTTATEIVVSKGKLMEVAKEISDYPGVCCVYNITGLSDGLIMAKFKNRSEMSNFTKWMLSLPLIERTNTHVVLTTAKEDLSLL